MRAWVTIRREDGAVLPAPVPAVEGASLLEVVVVDITEQGNRRPIKVARLMPIGEQRILAQLKLPRPVKFQGWTLVLSGVEELRDGHVIRGVAQTWLCQLAPPERAAGFKVIDTYTAGVRDPGRAWRERSGSGGRLALGDQYSSELQRQTTCAELLSYSISTLPTKRLVDAYIEFMSEEGFELGGLRIHSAHGVRPQRVVRDGWFCRYDIPERELTKHEARMLR
ncbi:hypothetical protein [Duganella callida]|uniref:Uncharacterized protein n=1 Tax=Duganella callida TaxID=2561932 RepID=A0A4Y9S7C8_9BURK|nr:hypothetical protein [Duganella callida]TFW15984.1 hypothetical protein E4L98_25150 [Duganella callida]